MKIPWYAVSLTKPSSRTPFPWAPRAGYPVYLALSLFLYLFHKSLKRYLWLYTIKKVSINPKEQKHDRPTSAPNQSCPARLSWRISSGNFTQKSRLARSCGMHSSMIWFMMFKTLSWSKTQDTIYTISKEYTFSDFLIEFIREVSTN